MTPRSAHDAGGFGVLVVCTANICRSPLVAGLLRHRLDQRFGAAAARVRIGSAGTRALVGSDVDPPVAALLAGATGRAPVGFAARQLEEHLVQEADLVITMTREHRRSVVELLPVAQRRTFTLRELARISRELRRGGRTGRAADPAAALRALAGAAPALRGPTAPADPATDDIADVHRHPLEEYERLGRRTGAAVDEVLAALAPPG